MKKGMIIIYLNDLAFQGFDDAKIIEFAKNMNKQLIEESLENGYTMFFIPTTNEASRMEKIDFDKPFIKGVNS